MLKQTNKQPDVSSIQSIRQTIISIKEKGSHREKREGSRLNDILLLLAQISFLFSSKLCFKQSFERLEKPARKSRLGL